MSDIFGSVSAPRLSFTPAQADTEALSRNFMTGVQLGQRARSQALQEEEFRKRYDEGTLPNKMLAAQIIGEQFKNNLAKQHVDWSVQAMEYFGNPSVQNMTPDQMQAWRPTGNPMIDAPMQKQINDQAMKVEYQADQKDWLNEIAKKETIRNASADDLPAYNESLDKNGRWTSKTSTLWASLAPKVAAWEQEQARNKASVLAAEIRGRYGMDRTQAQIDSREQIAADAVASREKIAQMNIDAKAKDVLSRGFHLGDHLLLNQYNNEYKTVQLLPTAKAREAGAAALASKWQPVIDSERAKQTAPAEVSKKRVRVKGPGGATGTIEEGDQLPTGWSAE